MLGFPPAIWFAGDSVSYLRTAITLRPDLPRESGFSVLLLMLSPFRTFAAVTAVQHLMGLGIAVMIYALARRYQLPRWGATLAALPVLLDGYVIQLEQEMLPDATFGFLVMAAVTLIVWWRGRPPVWAAALAGLALGMAAVTWPTGLPLLILLLAYLLFRTVGWQAFGAALAAGLIPLVFYLNWFDATYNQVAFTRSDGVYLWSRTMTFADCSVIKPPADERGLCPNVPIGHRRPADLWIWAKVSPIKALPSSEFSAKTNSLAMNFALRAITAQPGGYARAVFDGFAMSFTWNRPHYPTTSMSNRYQFSNATLDYVNPRTADGRALDRFQRDYTGGHLASTKAVQPFARLLISYQRWIYLRGTMVGVLLLIGLAAIARSWAGGGWRRLRGWGGPALFPWLTAIALLLVPVVTADFSLRYVVPAIPVASLAAAFAFIRRRPGPVAAEGQAAGGAGIEGSAAEPVPSTADPVPAGPDKRAAGSDRRRRLTP
jgi:hypothetical protein